MITCREVADFLMGYLDRELDVATRESFEEHLACCPPCVHYLESYRKTVELARKVAEDVPERVPEELVKAILAARKPKP